MNYLRDSAVNYAVTYALNPNPYYRYFAISGNQGGDCTNFISQCLAAGGAPMIYNPHNQWWYNRSTSGRVSQDTWSLSWAIAHSLYWFIKTNFTSRLPGVKGREVNSPDLLQKGDLIFFENENGVIFHSTIITSYINDMPLVSQHSFDALNIPVNRSYYIHKLHYMVISL